jgi:hypothetical protein
VVPPPVNRAAAVFPHHSEHPGRTPARGAGSLREALRQPRNLIPSALIVVLAIGGIVLLLSTLRRKAPPPASDFLVRLVVSSSQPETSLFGNERYLGEIGPRPREFLVVPGPMRLRLVRSYCQPRDTTFELQIGERLTVGPLDPVCRRP